ncbi:Uncharacterized protein HZ326_21146 [Fusarium oxysporum f. sp. albedinis]|nr:Uncharacterized protein HZ326_21146 [Fusarium oxysporum f. sp. albedinis]
MSCDGRCHNGDYTSISLELSRLESISSTFKRPSSLEDGHASPTLKIGCWLKDEEINKLDITLPPQFQRQTQKNFILISNDNSSRRWLPMSQSPAVDTRKEKGLHFADLTYPELQRPHVRRGSPPHLKILINLKLT